MSITYHLTDHQKHAHLKFAFLDGEHPCDFDAHRHDFSELFLVTEGTGNHTVASHVYPLSKGDVFIINGDVEHGFTHVDRLKLVNLMFEPTVPFFELPSMRNLPGYQAMFKVEPIARQSSDYRAKLTLTNEQLPIVLTLLQAMREEYSNGAAGFEMMLTSLMQQLVVSLSRMYQVQEHDTPQTTLALSRALVYIEQHHTQPDISSDQIAKAAFVSKRQLERLFRQFLNTSPNQFIRDTQLRHAKELLVTEPSNSIQSVAELCGFSDSNYFSKCFKQAFEMSPRHFRKHALNSSTLVVT